MSVPRVPHGTQRLEGTALYKVNSKTVTGRAEKGQNPVMSEEDYP